MLWQNIIRPLAFTLSAERAHYVSMGLFSAATKIGIGSILRKRYSVADPRLNVPLLGLNFKNPVGLAAGFDKDARWYNQLGCLGFGHVEIGTITGHGQIGNPKPRLFRLKKSQAIINRMGFNNAGSDSAARRLAASEPARRDDEILGVNIGKTKIVPVEEATSDYLRSFERLYEYGDYFTINVSSPNTPGLRSLQNKEPLIELISSIRELNESLSSERAAKPKPVLLKIAPDVTDGQLDDIADIAVSQKLSGVIATNTTIAREPISQSDQGLASEAGGLSGAPLTDRSRGVVSQLYQSLGGDIPVIGVGGIMNGEHAWQMILAGASLVQIYTGFIYGGPGMVRDINRYLLEKLAQNNLSNIYEAVGQKDKIQ